MELRQYLAIVRRRLLLIGIAVVCGVVGGYLSTSRTPLYSAEARIYVGARQLSTTNSGFVSSDAIAGIERVIRTYALMIDSRPVAEDALKRVPGINISPAALVAAASVTPLTSTQLLRIRVTSPDPSAAQQLANALSDAFVEKIQTFDPTAPAEPGQLPQLPAYVFERAQLPAVPASSGLYRRMVLGGLFGLVLAGAAAFLVEYVDITIRSTADAERRLELPVLGVIPFERQAPFLPIDAPTAILGG